MSDHNAPVPPPVQKPHPDARMMQAMSGEWLWAVPCQSEAPAAGGQADLIVRCDICREEVMPCCGSRLANCECPAPPPVPEGAALSEAQIDDLIRYHRIVRNDATVAALRELLQHRAQARKP